MKHERSEEMPMHIHASYSINLAEMGSNREEIHELAARRAAEVRRRLAALARMAPPENEEAPFVRSISEAVPDPAPDAYSTADGQQIAVVPLDQDPAGERNYGSLFSALA